jgi:phospholipase/carboxylesterase
MGEAPGRSEHPISGRADPHGGRPIAVAGQPLGQGRGAMVLVHGRNASSANILDLAGALDRPAFTYLAPAAAGNAWYPNSFMAARESNEPGLSSALRLIGSLVERVLGAGVPRERLMLLGFSQGACLTTEFAYHNPARYGGVIAYSGGLIGPPGTTWEATGSFGGAPVFLGCSDVDSHVPLARVNQTADVFERMGAGVTKRIYPGMGHLVNADEIAFTRTLMDAILDD